MMRFVKYDFQELSATSSIAKYRYGKYELKVVHLMKTSLTLQT